MVFVLDRHKKPLMPCTPKRARLLLERRRAVVDKIRPFTIRLKDRLQKDSVLQPLALCIDPGSKETGMAIVHETVEPVLYSHETRVTRRVVTLVNLIHRTWLIVKQLKARAALRRRRRYNLRHRPKRFDNRVKRPGWLPPSLNHILDSIKSTVKSLSKLCPIATVYLESVKFDMELMDKKSPSSIEYQKGTKNSLKIIDYLKKVYNNKCVYCDKHVKGKMTVDHVVPRSRGGTNTIRNLVLACRKCNQRKGNMDVRAFIGRDMARIYRVLRDNRTLKHAAHVNTIRDALRAMLSTMTNNIINAYNCYFDLHVASGVQTHANRHKLGIGKAHCLDAACVGQVDVLKNYIRPVLYIKSIGRGAYKRTRTNRHGFPIGSLMRTKFAYGYQSGDLVKAIVTTGKKVGTYVGKVAIRQRGYFNIETGEQLVKDIHYRFCRLVQRSNGYSYFYSPIVYQ